MSTTGQMRSSAWQVAIQHYPHEATSHGTKPRRTVRDASARLRRRSSDPDLLAARANYDSLPVIDSETQRRPSFVRISMAR
jgi:hypothetical protein